MTSKRLLSVAFYFGGMICGMQAAAADTDGGRFIARFDTAFAALDSLIFRSPANLPLDDRAFDDVSYRATSTIAPDLDDALCRNTEAQIRQGNAPTGLQLTGQAYYRPTNALGLDDENGESRYRAKFQAELRWYLFQSGLFGADGRRRAAILREDIERASYEKERTDINDYQVKILLAERHDSLLAGVLHHRISSLRLLDEAHKYLLSSENISSDEIVRTLDDRMEAERKLAGIPGSYPPAKSLADVPATRVMLDSAALIRHIEASNADIKILRLRARLLETQAQNETYLNNLRVAPFVRYSYYDRRHLPNSSNLDVGVTFTIPLSQETARKKESLRAQRAVVLAEEERISRRVADKVALTAAEIDRLNRASEGEARRVTEIREYIAMRSRAYERGIGEHNRLARAREYNMYLECLERLIDSQYRRDCLLADLQALLPDVSVMRFCTVSPLRF